MTDRLEEIRKNLDVWGAEGADEQWLIGEVERLRLALASSRDLLSTATERGERLLNDWRAEKARADRAVVELKAAGQALGETLQSLETVEGLLTEEYSTAGESVDQIAAALELVHEYAQIDGDHHKAWVLDQIVRILTGPAYVEWVKAYERGGEWNWDEGIAP